MRLEIRRIGAIKDRDEVVGNQTRVKVVKNKLAPPFKVVEFDIMYGVGISKTGELIDFGVKAGIVEKSGSWFSYDSQRIGQGRENAKTFLGQNADVAAAIEAAIRGAAETDSAGKTEKKAAAAGGDGEGADRPAEIASVPPVQGHRLRRPIRELNGGHDTSCGLRAGAC